MPPSTTTSVRPTAPLAAALSGAGRPVRPRRAGSPDAPAAGWFRASDVPGPLRTELRDEGAQARLAPWPALTEDAWRAFLRDGDRAPYEQPYGERRRQVVSVALALAADGDPGRDDALAARVAGILDETTWCVPAHDASTHLGHRELPDPAVPVLDLFQAQTAGTLAALLRLLPGWVDAHPDVAARVRAEIAQRVLRPFLADARSYHWFALPSNWNPWIVSNVLLAASVLLDGDDLTDLVALAVESLDGYLAGVPADGGCDEGAAYWWQSAARAFEAAEQLAALVPDAADAIFAVPVLGALARYPRVVHLGGPWSATFGDGPARAPRAGSTGLTMTSPLGLLWRYARRTGQDDLARFARSLRVENAHAGAADGTLLERPTDLARAVAILGDPTWRDAPPSAAHRPTLEYLPTVEVLSTTGRAGGRELRVVARGGHDGEPHNHLDVGSFVVALDGEPVVVDPGAGSYTKDSFSARRYEQWWTRSSFHNLPEIDGILQGVGTQFAARTHVEQHPDESSTMRLDLSAVYPDLDGRLERTLRVDHRHASLEVHDAWSLTAAPRDVRVHLMLRERPSRRHDGALLLRATPAGPALTLQTDGAAVDVRPERVVLDDRRLAAVWGQQLWRLALVVRTPGAEGELGLRLRPADRF